MTKIRLAILISGGGTTAEAVIRACQSGELPGITPVVVITDRESAGGIEKAKALGIETVVVNPKIEGELLKTLQKYNVDLVSQNGWLALTPPDVVEFYSGKIINQHPGPLDPGRHADFGGRGMYGARVVCARNVYCWLTGTDFWTEAVTHFVTERFDEGDLIRVERMKMPEREKIEEDQLKNLSSELIAETKKVQEQLLPLEHKNVIETLRMFAKGSAAGFRRQTPLIPDENKKYLDIAKQTAIELFPNG